MWVKTTDGDKPGTIHYENQSTKIAITMRDSIWMLQSLNLHSISPIVFGNGIANSESPFFALARRLSVFFALLQNLGRETREISVSLKWHGRAMWHGQTVPIRCPLKSSSFFDPAPTGDHATQQHARASARAAPMAQILGHKPNNLHLGPKSPTSQNTQQMNPMQSRHQKPLTPRGVPRRAISMNQHLPSSSKAQTWLQEGVW